MSKHLTIITGASRGMGLAMAEQLLAAGHDLLCISRKHNDSLGARATGNGQRCDQWPVDLAEPQPAAARLQAWLAAQPATTYESVTLINNAALLPRAMPTGALDAAEIAQAMRVNLEAPMLLTSAFLRATQAWTGQRKVLNISSGLGRRAMASQGPYCAAKAGLDHFTRCVALEEAGQPNGAKVSSLAPGVIDTDMQIQLRSGDASQFPDVGNFIGMKANGALSSPADAAAKVLGVLARPDFGSNPITDVRD
ncbi:SDR family NAD(P)-dependent oxidoreductase [Caenimonas sp. SL110]|uniref:SDR family NAD(P)-dependent oxidoreductase n=1 Tax=Caenimonas sp. SL110 TaxID=1450524 RepID=UPI000652A80A|nr:SDR family NAD(P)-dependent oxidoreductase [Caenimonas sp. SL110]